MKPGCPKCFKVAEKNGNEYICPSCGDVVAQIPETLSVEEQNELLKKVDESYVRIINDLEEDCERYFDQRNRLIEGLQSIRKELDRLSRESRQKWKHEGDMYEQGRADAYDEADMLIRDTLKECVVTVE